MTLLIALNTPEVLDTPAALGLATALIMAVTYRIRRHRARIR